MKTRWIVVVLIAALMASGCVTGNHGNTPDNPAAGDDMAGIDAALANGPVLVEFEANWSDDCTREHALIEGLKAEYPGVTFMYLNTEDNGRLAYLFSVNDIPQMNVIVNKNADGSYTYMNIGGLAMSDRRSSAIVGYHGVSDLKTALDAAVKARG